MNRRRFGAGMTFALMVGAALCAGMPSVAQAHAAYKDSNPPDESTVSQPPAEIWAEYTEPPTDASYLRVYDPCGIQVDNGDSRPEGYRVYVTMSAERAGTYRVTWFVDSAIDAHSTRGTFTFTVTGEESCPGSEPEENTEVRSERQRDAGSGGAGSGSRRATSGDPGSDAAGVGRAERARLIEERRSGDDLRRRRSGRDGGSAGVAAPDDEPLEDEARQPGLFEDIPIGGLVLGLSMAALIGAAGGFIYAGIMGYTRTGT